ncbi:MAG: efflux RND transporter permease subunit [Bacteroidota bacterium]
MLRFTLPRPIATLLISASVVLLGLLASWRLPLGLLPEVETPTLQVKVALPNYQAELVERQALSTLRTDLNNLKGLVELESWAVPGEGYLRLHYRWGTDMQAAYLRLNERIDELLGKLPSEMSHPQVDRFEVTDLPVLQLSLRANDRSLTQIKRLAETTIRRRLEQSPGIALCKVQGGATPQVAIYPRANQMAALGISLGQLQTALQALNLSSEQLVFRQEPYRYTLTLAQEISSLAELRELPLVLGQDRLITLDQIAEVDWMLQSRNQAVVDARGESIFLSLYQQSGANLLSSVKEAKAVVQQLRQQYPSLDLQVLDDGSILVSEALRSLWQSLLIGASLGIGLMFLAFRQWLPTLLIASIVPIALIVALLAMYALGLTINVFSLAGLIVGVGILIDNGIIVVDNIQRSLQKEESWLEGVIAGSSEVAAPLLGSALTTVCVFVPPALLSGLPGALFAEQAWALSLALFASVIVAVILTPTLYQLGAQLSPATKQTKHANSSRREANPLVAKYEKSLIFLWRKPAWSILGFAATLALGGLAWSVLPQQTLPETPPPALDLIVTWEEGLSLVENASRSQVLCRGLETFPGVKAAWGFVGSWSRLSFDPPSPSETVILRFSLDEGAAAAELKANIEGWLLQQYSSLAFKWLETPNLLNQVLPATPPDLVANWLPLQGQLSLTQAQRARIETLLEQTPAVDRFNWSYPDEVTTLRLTLREEVLNQYGLTRNTLITHLKASLGQLPAGRLQEPDRNSLVVISWPVATDQSLARRLAEIRLDSPAVPLATFIQVSEEPARMVWYGQVAGPCERLEIRLSKSGSADHLIQELRSLGLELDLGLRLTGNYYQARATANELVLMLVLALVLLYLIMAAQFESLWQPLIVLLIATMGLAGALLALWIGGCTFNLMAGLGILMVSGIVVNDSILKIDTINRYRRQGLGLSRAILLAGRHRLRPIVLTMLTTLLAVLPILLDSGTGAALQAPLAVALIGGLLFDTLGSIFFLPGLYLWFAKRLKSFRP